MKLLIIILIFVIAVKDCEGYDYKNDLREIRVELSKIVDRLEKLNKRKR